MSYDSRLVRELTDRHAIADAVQRYCRGVDRCDTELICSAYFDDAVDDHGSFKGNAWEFAEWANKVHQRVWASTMHVIAHHTVELDGDVAHGETYVVAYLRRLDGSAIDVAGGRYIDRFERRSGEWRIADRVFVWEWSSSLDPKGSLIDGDIFTQGQRSREDLSYFGAQAGA